MALTTYKCTKCGLAVDQTTVQNTPQCQQASTQQTTQGTQQINGHAFVLNG